MLLLIAALVCIGLIVAAALGRVSWAAAAIACIAILVVVALLSGDVRADLTD